MPSTFLYPGAVVTEPGLLAATTGHRRGWPDVELTILSRTGRDISTLTHPRSRDDDDDDDDDYFEATPRSPPPNATCSASHPPDRGG